MPNLEFVRRVLGWPLHQAAIFLLFFPLVLQHKTSSFFVEAPQYAHLGICGLTVIQGGGIVSCSAALSSDEKEAGEGKNPSSGAHKRQYRKIGKSKNGNSFFSIKDIHCR